MVISNFLFCPNTPTCTVYNSIVNGGSREPLNIVQDSKSGEYSCVFFNVFKKGGPVGKKDIAPLKEMDEINNCLYIENLNLLYKMNKKLNELDERTAPKEPGFNL